MHPETEEDVAVQEEARKDNTKMAFEASETESVDDMKDEPQPVKRIQKVEGLSNSDADATDVCRYYCPLCMMYFEAVYETVCCGHTICDECAIGYMAHLKVDASTSASPSPDHWLANEDTIRLVDGISWTLPNACPFCREIKPPQDLPEDIRAAGPAEGFQLKIVYPGVAEGCLRNYEDSPAPTKRLSTMSGSVKQANVIEPSPLRVGDSLEKMHAKMIPFERVHVQPQPATEQQSTPRSGRGPGLPAMPPAQPPLTNQPAAVAAPAPALALAQDLCVTPGPAAPPGDDAPVQNEPEPDIIGGEISVAQPEPDIIGGEISVATR